MDGRTGAVASGAGLALGVALVLAGRPALGWAALIFGMAVFCLTTALSLNIQIALAILAGVALGITPESGIELTLPAGRVFIALLKMLIAPMILLSIAHGIASLGGARALGRLGIRTLVLYVVTMALAVAVGLIAVNVFEPGSDSGLLGSAFFEQAVKGGTTPPAPASLGPFLLETVFQATANPFASLAEGRVLPIVIFAILLGAAIVRLGAAGQPLVTLLHSGHAAIMTIIAWFLRLAPVGVFALIGHLVATVGFRALAENLLAFSLVVIGATLFHALVTLPLIARALGGVGPGALFRGLREALVVAFATSSSAATLPVTMRCVEQNLGVPQQVSSFVLPLGATVNMDGTALYEAIAAIFIANVYGIELSLASQLVVFLIAMLMAMGAPAIPSAGMVTMIVVLEAVGLPAEAVGILIAIDRFLDTFRTACNVEGDAVVALCVRSS